MALIFDGVDIETISPVKIIDITVGQPKQSVVTAPRPISPGQAFIRSTYTTRVITVQFALLITSPIEREAALQALRAWAHPGQPGTLTVDSRPGQSITAVCTGLPDPSMRQWWEDKLKITFTCYDPLFVDITEQTAASGAQAVVLGDAPPLAYLTIDVGSGYNTVTVTDGTRTLTLSGQMSAGTITIDLEHEKITHSVDGNISSLLTLTSRFPQLKIGINTITGAILHYKPRWL